MGSSYSIVFKYRDHCLIKRDCKFFWVYYKDGVEMSSMEVNVERTTIDTVTPWFNKLGNGPLIYKVAGDSNYEVIFEDYIPTHSNLSYQSKKIYCYKLTQTSIWSKTFYVRN